MTHLNLSPELRKFMVLLPDLKRKAEQASADYARAKARANGAFPSPSRLKRIRHLALLEQRAWALYQAVENEPATDARPAPRYRFPASERV